MPDHASAIPVPELISHGKRPPLPALTSIRFFAAMYIVAYHCSLSQFIAMPQLVADFFNYGGYTAVTLFFGLSGFILAYNYPRVASRRDFWISRFARIYPAYFLAILVWVVITLANPLVRHQHVFLPATCLSIFLLQSWLPAFATIINPIGWTLSVEAFLYAVFPFANPFCRRPTRSTISLFAAVCLALALAPLALAHTHPSLAVAFARQIDGTVPLYRLGTFFIGMLAGASFSRKQRRHAALLPISLLCTMALVCWPSPDLSRPLKTLLLSCSYTGIIYALATVEWPVLTNRWMLLGGEISYSIYLLQFIVFRLMSSLVQHIYPGSVFNNAYCVPLLILISWLSFRFYEVPARLRIRNLFRRLRPIDT